MAGVLCHGLGILDRSNDELLKMTAQDYMKAFHWKLKKYQWLFFFNMYILYVENSKENSK